MNKNNEIDNFLTSFSTGGVFHFQQIRSGKVIDEWDDHNLVVDQGLNHMLDVVLSGGTQQAAWFLGLFEGNYTPVGTDTAANIASNSTECTAYDETVRQTWIDTGAASKNISNTASKATFTMNATKTIYGAFLISDSVKGGADGVLFAASRFTNSRTFYDNDELLVTYTVSAASS